MLFLMFLSFVEPLHWFYAMCQPVTVALALALSVELCMAGIEQLCIHSSGVFDTQSQGEVLNRAS